MTAVRGGAVPVRELRLHVRTIPTDAPESDGTAEWEATTIVIVEAHAGDAVGLGYTYGDAACAGLIESILAEVVTGADAMAVPKAWEAMSRALRNAGRPGVGAMAVAAVDTALWDLKARLLELPLATLLGACRDEVPVYGSGGFTSYSDERLAEQLGGWAGQGIPRVKMKIGREPGRDPHRVSVARDAIGPETALFVDANGALSRKQALGLAEQLTEYGVTWFEEPVSSDDLAGLRLVRDRAPAGMEIAAGEYGYLLRDFHLMLEAGAVDCLQADVSRCQGITGFLRVAALCKARSMELSGHCAPALHLHACCAAPAFRHLEYFHDHVRIEQMLFDGVVEPSGGALRPDLSRPGNGLELKEAV
ncbi:MAG TPA: enolase C-terminal domain-like protein [Gaiellales bacterium]|jgi:L-alanine-DL-glutamate epimerase-like enolase superfamily enzyme|nr:enolase C-terminal domain-like protein [Gaiellales bacterium]